MHKASCRPQTFCKAKRYIIKKIILNTYSEHIFITLENYGAAHSTKLAYIIICLTTSGDVASGDVDVILLNSTSAYAYNNI